MKNKTEYYTPRVTTYNIYMNGVIAQSIGGSTGYTGVDIIDGGDLSDGGDD